MTDKEIKSSLEVIATTGNCEECKIRNCKWGTCNCSQITANAALELINHQQAEIKRLQKEVNLVSIQFQDLQERYEEAQTEIERLEKIEIEIDDFCRRLCHMRMLNGSVIASYEDLQNYIQQEKSEAVKEFAERLKEELISYCEIIVEGNDMQGITGTGVDKIVNEMDYKRQTENK